MPSTRAASSRRFLEYKEARKSAPPERHAGLDADHQPSSRKRQRSMMPLVLAFWGLVREHRWTLAAALATLTLSTGLGLALPYSTKLAIDYVLTDHPGPKGLPWGLAEHPRKTLLLWLSLAMISVTLLNVMVGMWGRWQTTRLTKRTQASVRKKVFEHAVRLPLHRVHALKSGGVASILREDAGGVAELLFSLIYNPWRAIIQLIGTLVILAMVDWKLLVGSIALIPVIWMTHRTWINSIRPIYRDIRRTRTSIDAHAAEAFAGMRVVRGFSRQQGEAQRFIASNHYMARQELLAWWRSRLLEVVWQVMIPVASAGVLLYGGSRVIDGTLTIGDVMMFSAYLLMLLGPLESLVSTASSVQNQLAGLDRVLDVLDEPTEYADIRAQTSLDRANVHGDIAFEDVSFAYPRSKERKVDAKDNGAASPAPTSLSPTASAPHAPRLVLEKIDLRVRAGETIALVGPSGAGKTTLCNLAARFYDPTSGRVTLDGVDLRDIEVSSFRRLLGIVEQDVFLFDGTVRENIAYARRNASEEDVVRAAEAANAHNFIQDLERGYDTVIGERGVRLSGGQKQRLAIARAILADPKILILDEATSNLDSESEILIQRSLARLMRGRTSFVIAHRLSTIRHASRIVVIEGGRITEIGTHDELMDRGGRYADLVRLQTEDPARERAAQAGPAGVNGTANGAVNEPHI
ncbi:MAG: ABC transporter ATP-binding protein [Phycisphaerales bacterium]|nr:ABC transporter ATP-binding protein [Phycisphaerales bacterium]